MRKMPLGPRVSPMLMLMPYFSGMRTSCCHTEVPPQKMVMQTVSAPLRTSRRSADYHLRYRMDGDYFKKEVL